MKMSLNINMSAKSNLLILIALVATSILSNGCGNNRSSAPFGSKLTFNPASITVTTPIDICLTPMKVIVQDADLQPLSKTIVSIAGGFANPNLSGGGLYQFFDGPDCSGTAVNSGFDGVTDKNGVYTFSILVPATSVFIDKLEATSGTAVASADFNFN